MNTMPGFQAIPESKHTELLYRVNNSSLRISAYFTFRRLTNIQLNPNSIYTLRQKFSIIICIKGGNNIWTHLFLFDVMVTVETIRTFTDSKLAVS